MASVARAALLGAAALIAMIFDRGFDDPAATLWMTMLAIQSLPYLATVVTAGISAMSYGRNARAIAAIASPPEEPVLPKAA